MLKTYEKFTNYKHSYNKKFSTYEISMKELENNYKFFHVSSNLLLSDNDEKTFTFTAKIPYTPYVDVDDHIIEDDFTNRVSLSNDIKSCLDALPTFAYKKFYLYGIDLKMIDSDDIETINLKSMIDRCPVIKGKKYGTDFNLHDWLKALSTKEYEEIQKFYYKKTIKDDPDLAEKIQYSEIKLEDFIYAPSDLPVKYKKKFFACVPDADTTNEFWSLKNLKMDYLGQFENVHDKFVNLYVKPNEDIPAVIKKLNYSKK